MVERQRDAARANLDALGEDGERRAQHRGVRVEAAEILKVTLGRPDGPEAVAVGELRALDDEAILLFGILRAVVREEVEAEAHRARGRPRPPIRRLVRLAVR
jgi:hypothetical protein